MKKEIWRIVKNYPDYMVSNKGRVKSLVYRKERMLKPGYGSNGYLTVGLTKNKKRITNTVHRLICQVFIPNPENKPETNHINGIKTDNRIENLEWCTRSENAIHSYKNGLQKPKQGEDRWNSSLSNNNVLNIKRLLRDSKFTQTKIGVLFGVSPDVIHSISKNINYSSIKL